MFLSRLSPVRWRAKCLSLLIFFPANPVEVMPLPGRAVSGKWLLAVNRANCQGWRGLTEKH